jgi:hypothetical protein
VLLLLLLSVCESKWSPRKLGTDAFLMEVSSPNESARSGKALVLAFRGTEPTELVDFQSDFDLFPVEGEWGRNLQVCVTSATWMESFSWHRVSR